MTEQALAANSQQTELAKEDLYSLFSLNDTYIYYYIYNNIWVSVQQHRTIKYPSHYGMTITSEKESDIIVYTLERNVSFPRENQYLFVANCAW